MRSYTSRSPKSKRKPSPRKKRVKKSSGKDELNNSDSDYELVLKDKNWDQYQWICSDCSEVIYMKTCYLIWYVC